MDINQPQIDTQNKINQTSEYILFCKNKIENYDNPLSEQELALLFDQTTYFDQSQNNMDHQDKIDNQFSYTKFYKFDYKQDNKKKRLMEKKVKTFYEPLFDNFKTNNQNPSNCIISPDGTAKLCWDLLCMFLIFYEIMSIPFFISFDPQPLPGLDIFIDVVFFTDILLNFTTAYYSNGQLLIKLTI